MAANRLSETTVEADSRTSSLPDSEERSSASAIADGSENTVVLPDTAEGRRAQDPQMQMTIEKGGVQGIDNILFHLLSETPDPRLLAINGTNLDEKARELIVLRVGKLMIDHYVYPAMGQTVARSLIQHLANGDYDKITYAGDLSRRLTEDIRQAAHDKHVNVYYQDPQEPKPDSEPGDDASTPNDHGLAKAELLPGNIGFIDLRHFEPAGMAKETFAKAMKIVEPADAIIFDMRQNGGGAPEGVQLLCSYLFDERIHLNSLYWRKGDRTEEFWTLDTVVGSKRPRVPVFVLTSSRTFSGAEEFTYNLKINKRATIVGEVTGGGANPGEEFEINSRMGIFVSTGRAINPVTNTNWEGVGIQPDVKVKAEAALESALKLARVAAKKYARTRVK